MKKIEMETLKLKYGSMACRHAFADLDSTLLIDLKAP